MATNFKNGDVVILKSGGPKMTITGKGRNREYSVTWFNEKMEQQWGEFDGDSLELA